MPLQLPDNDSAPFYILGKDAAGLLGAQLASGQKVAVVSGDPATVVVTMDASPKIEPVSEKQSLASGTVASAQPPANPNAPINLTATVSNSDGSTAETVTDTVTIIPGAATSLGEVFGATTTVSGTAPAPVGP